MASGEVDQRAATHTRRLATAGSLALLVKAAGLIGGLAVNVLLARLLSQPEMGIYFLAVTIAGFVAVVARFGMNQTIVREVASAVQLCTGGRARQALWKASLVMVAVAAIGAVLLFSGAGSWIASDLFEAPRLGDVYSLVAVLLLSLALQSIVSEGYRGLDRIVPASLYDNVATTVIFALCLAAAYVVAGTLKLETALGMYAFICLLVLVTGAVFLWRRITGLAGEGEISGRDLVVPSLPLLVNNLTFFLFSNGALWVVGAFSPPSEVAVYGAASRLVLLVTVPLMIVNMTVQPFIVQQWMRGDRAVLQRVLRASATLAMVPAVIASAPLVLAGELVMSSVFGAAYSGGGTILSILAAAFLLNTWTGSCGNLLIFSGNQRDVMNVTLLTGPVAFGFAVILAPRYGGLGVAVGMAAALVLQNGLAWWLARRRTGVWTHAALNLSGLRTSWRLIKPDVS